MSAQLSKELIQRIARYIDENYIDFRQMQARDTFAENRRSGLYHRDMKRTDSCESSHVLEERLPCAPMATAKALSLEDMLKRADAGFTETLLNLIDKTGKKDSEIYKKANLSKQHFSKIRNNPDYRPTKSTALALALALELDLDATKDLIGRAGYALTNSSKFDLIIQFFIEQGNYNVVEINIALYEFDQSLLGG